MFLVQNLFVGERKELEKAKQKIFEELSTTLSVHSYSEIMENPFPHFYIIESTAKINPCKFLNLLSGTTIKFYWSAKDVENKKFLRTEGDEAKKLLQGFSIKIEYTDGTFVSENEICNISDEEELLSSVQIYLGKRFNSIEELSAYSDEDVKSIEIWKYRTCDVFGNVLHLNDITLMYEYINVDAFIKWLNFKLRYDGVYEVTGENVLPYLKDMEVQMHSKQGLTNLFVLPPYATKSGEYEAYKYTFRNINGKDTICL